MSEIMTIVIHFHQSQYRNFKAYYTEHVSKQLNSEFPALVSYNRFVELMPRVQLPLLAYFIYCRGKCSGISFVDSTPIKVCHNLRIPRHKVFSGLAGRGKSSTGWFYGFKLHLIVNDQGEILSLGLVDDIGCDYYLSCNLTIFWPSTGSVKVPSPQFPVGAGLNSITTTAPT